MIRVCHLAASDHGFDPATSLDFFQEEEEPVFAQAAAFGAFGWPGTGAGSFGGSQLLSSLKASALSPAKEAELGALLKRSEVPGSKDYAKWDFHVILQLLNGPAASPAGVCALLKPGSKFVKR